MGHSVPLIDDAPVTKFHKKLTVFSSGGPFIDGYALSIVGIALITMVPALGLNPVEIGLIGAASLVGIFAGGAVFGWVTDKVGRHTMYILDLIALALFSVLSGLVTEVWQIVALRFLLGVAIGADYPIATSLLAEFLPKRVRGRMLGATFVVWAIGAAAAYMVGYALSGSGENAWRWLLMSPAIFAIVTLLCRLGTPESPRWLLSHGKVDEARSVIKKVYGPEYDIESLGHESEEGHERASVKSLFQGEYLKRTIFVAIFWTAQVIPMFAVYTFAPDLLTSFGLEGDANLYGGSLLIALMFVVGGIPGLWLVEKIGRRKLLIWSFVIATVALGLPAIIPNVGAVPLFIALAVFAVASGSANFLEVVYPNELFPTEVRATAVGIGTAVSRIGSAVSTYLMPMAILHYGAAGSLAIGAVISLVGLIATVLLAPETMNRNLSEMTRKGNKDSHKSSTVTPAVPDLALQTAAPEGK